MSKGKESATPVPFSGDHPLTDPAQDRLDYAPFSRLLAQSISGMSPEEGMVVTVNGPWGSGKSTVLNFVLYYLEHDFAGQQVLPIHFNPWWFSGREDLTRLLIGQIRARLGDKDYGELKSKLADFADLLTRIPGVPGRDAGEFIADKLRGQPDLVSLKNKIAALLRSSDRRILVIIDDIDRLAPEEICDLFRTIKATGNFPNVIYLLAFDAEIVVQSLERTFVPCGCSYLEKIVQVPFALPMPDKVQLRKLLFDKLDEVLAGTEESNFDSTYWINVYFDGIDHFITTPRDIVRLINVLRATYPCVKNEVNSVDFIAVEAVRVFMPGLYETIRRNQDLLAGVTSESGGKDTTKERKVSYEAWLELLPEGDRDSAKKLLSRMFPRFNSAFENMGYGRQWLSEWRKQLRVCSSDFFPVYFRFSLGADSISNAEITELLKVAGNKEAFCQALLKHAGQIRSDGSSRVRAVLERLEDYTEKEIPQENIQAIISAFFQIGDQLLLKCDERRGMFDFGNDIRMGRLIHQLLRRVNEATRFKIISSAIQGGSGLYMIVHEAAVWGQEHGKFSKGEPRPKEECTLAASHLERIEARAVAKIRDAAQTGSLLSTPHLPHILHAWRT